MDHSTWHILTQVEWYSKLRDEYHCVEVEIEYDLWIPEIGHYRVDVYGKTIDGKIYVVEIGKVIGSKSRDMENMSKLGKFIYFRVKRNRSI